MTSIKSGRERSEEAWHRFRVAIGAHRHNFRIRQANLLCLRKHGRLRFYVCCQALLLINGGSKFVCVLYVAKAMRRILRAKIMMASVLAQPCCRQRV
jgi:hypothetical protein